MVQRRLRQSKLSEIYDRDNIGGELYCFGRYYKKSRIEQVKDGIPKMTEERYNFKEKLAGMYTERATRAVEKNASDRPFIMIFYFFL